MKKEEMALLPVDFYTKRGQLLNCVRSNQSAEAIARRAEASGLERHDDFMLFGYMVVRRLPVPRQMRLRSEDRYSLHWYENKKYAPGLESTIARNTRCTCIRNGRQHLLEKLVEQRWSDPNRSWAHKVRVATHLVDWKIEATISVFPLNAACSLFDFTGPGFALLRDIVESAWTSKPLPWALFYDYLAEGSEDYCEFYRKSWSE